jgi:hypothetical protein
VVEKQSQKLGISRSARAFNYREANSWLNPDQSSFKEADLVTACILRAETYHVFYVRKRIMYSTCGNVSLQNSISQRKDWHGCALQKTSLDTRNGRSYLRPLLCSERLSHKKTQGDSESTGEKNLKKNEWHVTIEASITDENNCIFFIARVFIATRTIFQLYGGCHHCR